MAAITDLATLTTVADDDYLPIRDTSAGTDKKIARSDLLGSLTVTVNAAAGNSQAWQLSGTNRARIELQTNASLFVMEDFDNSNLAGPRLQAGRNSNASTPAAGFLRLSNLGGTGYRIWPDTAGNLRIGTSDPTNAADTSGTVVGAQTSSLDSKTIAGKPLPTVDILAAVQAGADAVRRFTYRNGAFNGEEFSGVVVDYAPRYGMDRDGEHPAGKSLNVATVIGDLLLAVANLAERVAALEAAHE